LDAAQHQSPLRLWLAHDREAFDVTTLGKADGHGEGSGTPPSAIGMANIKGRLESTFALKAAIARQNNFWEKTALRRYPN
jgi:hypothetical protein